MLPDGLYTKGIPGLGEAIRVDAYAAITNKSLYEVLEDVANRKLLGVLHNNIWYIEAPPYCEKALQGLTAHSFEQVRMRDAEQEQQREKKLLAQKEIEHKRTANNHFGARKIMNQRQRITLITGCCVWAISLITAPRYQIVEGVRLKSGTVAQIANQYDFPSVLIRSLIVISLTIACFLFVSKNKSDQ